MEDLIKALKIFKKYLKEDLENPVGCGYDELFITGEINISNVNEEDIKELEGLSFTWNEDWGGFSSFRFGGCWVGPLPLL